MKNRFYTNNPFAQYEVQIFKLVKEILFSTTVLALSSGNGGFNSNRTAVNYVYLCEIVEPNKHAFNTLAIVVEEAVDNLNGIVTPPLGHPELNAVFVGAHPIESVPGCKTFRLYWRNYIAYLVTDEIAGSTAPKGFSEARYTGRVFRSTVNLTFSITLPPTQAAATRNRTTTDWFV